MSICPSGAKAHNQSTTTEFHPCRPRRQGQAIGSCFGGWLWRFAGLTEAASAPSPETPPRWEQGGMKCSREGKKRNEIGVRIWRYGKKASRRRGFEKSRPLNKTSEHILTRCRAAFKARKTLLGVSVGCKVKVIRSCPFGRDVMLSLGSEVRG